jgi:hypothetical protein
VGKEYRVFRKWNSPDLSYMPSMGLFVRGVNNPVFGWCRHLKENTIAKLREFEMLIEVFDFKPSLMEKEYKIESLVTDLTGQSYLDI